MYAGLTTCQSRYSVEQRNYWSMSKLHGIYGEFTGSVDQQMVSVCCRSYHIVEASILSVLYCMLYIKI